jgi:hypothetical protein
MERGARRRIQCWYASLQTRLGADVANKRVCLDARLMTRFMIRCGPFVVLLELGCLCLGVLDEFLDEATLADKFLQARGLLFVVRS